MFELCPVSEFDLFIVSRYHLVSLLVYTLLLPIQPSTALRLITYGFNVKLRALEGVGSLFSVPDWYVMSVLCH